VNQQVSEGERARVAADGAAAGRTATRPTHGRCVRITNRDRTIPYDRVVWQSLLTATTAYRKPWDIASENVSLNPPPPQKKTENWVCEIWGVLNSDTFRMRRREFPYSAFRQNVVG
jgi:hypothetical protein